MPKGEEMIGWRIAVYWKEEQHFYEGTVEDYDSELDQHTVSYVDGKCRQPVGQWESCRRCSWSRLESPLLLQAMSCASRSAGKSSSSSCRRLCKWSVPEEPPRGNAPSAAILTMPPDA